jgi:hypothetical protein
MVVVAATRIASSKSAATRMHRRVRERVVIQQAQYAVTVAVPAGVEKLAVPMAACLVAKVTPAAGPTSTAIRGPIAVAAVISAAKTDIHAVREHVRETHSYRVILSLLMVR